MHLFSRVTWLVITIIVTMILPVLCLAVVYFLIFSLLPGEGNPEGERLRNLKTSVATIFALLNCILAGLVLFGRWRQWRERTVFLIVFLLIMSLTISLYIFEWAYYWYL